MPSPAKPEDWWLVFMVLVLVIAAVVFKAKGHKPWNDGLIWRFIVSSPGFLLLPILLFSLVKASTPPLKNADWLERATPWLEVFFALMLGLFCNFVIAVEKGRDEKGIESQTRIWKSLLIVFVFVALVMIVTRNLAFVPGRVMNIYKFGNFKATLLVDETGCAIASRNGFPPSADSKTCPLPNVTVLSRLGNAYYLRKDGESGCFTIPGQHVLSWSVERIEHSPPELPCQ
jgi:hypothetical protein